MGHYNRKLGLRLVAVMNCKLHLKLSDRILFLAVKDNR